LTQHLKEYTEEKVRASVNAYLDSKLAVEEEVSQPGLGLEVKDPAPRDGGAAYAD
jgi:hypothetical protein